MQLSKTTTSVYMTTDITESVTRDEVLFFTDLFGYIQVDGAFGNFKLRLPGRRDDICAALSVDPSHHSVDLDLEGWEVKDNGERPKDHKGRWNRFELDAPAAGDFSIEASRARRTLTIGGKKHEFAEFREAAWVRVEKLTDADKQEIKAKKERIAKARTPEAVSTEEDMLASMTVK